MTMSTIWAATTSGSTMPRHPAAAIGSTAAAAIDASANLASHRSLVVGVCWAGVDIAADLRFRRGPRVPAWPEARRAAACSPRHGRMKEGRPPAACLPALADAPDAFATMVENQAALLEAVWHQPGWGPAAANFIVRANGSGIGMAAVMAELALPRRAATTAALDRCSRTRRSARRTFLPRIAVIRCPTGLPDRRRRQGLVSAKCPPTSLSPALLPRSWQHARQRSRAGLRASSAQLTRCG